MADSVGRLSAASPRTPAGSAAASPGTVGDSASIRDDFVPSADPGAQLHQNIRALAAAAAGKGPGVVGASVHGAGPVAGSASVQLQDGTVSGTAGVQVTEKVGPGELTASAGIGGRQATTASHGSADARAETRLTEPTPAGSLTVSAGAEAGLTDPHQSLHAGASLQQGGLTADVGVTRVQTPGVNATTAQLGARYQTPLGPRSAVSAAGTVAVTDTHRAGATTEETRESGQIGVTSGSTTASVAVDHTPQVTSASANVQVAAGGGFHAGMGAADVNGKVSGSLGAGYSTPHFDANAAVLAGRQGVAGVASADYHNDALDVEAAARAGAADVPGLPPGQFAGGVYVNLGIGPSDAAPRRRPAPAPSHAAPPHSAPPSASPPMDNDDFRGG